MGRRHAVGLRPLQSATSHWAALVLKCLPRRGAFVAWEALKGCRPVVWKLMHERAADS